MFEHDHYVPVLRWKGAERKAVQNLDADTRRRVTPLIELVPKQITEQPIERAAKQVAESWGWKRLTFVDFNLLPEDALPVGIPRFTKRACGCGVELALTTGLVRGEAYQRGVLEALESNQCGICLRLHPHDFRGGGIEMRIMKALSLFGLEPSSVHLILDFQSVCGESPNVLESVNQIPARTAWRTLTVVAGAFPKDLADLEKNSQHLLPRSDLSSWGQYLAQARGRLASFGDYTVQHGVFEEHEGKQFNFSASLRYAAANEWVIMRGEGVLNEDGPGYHQWPANAQLLCERDEFSGEGFSWGDNYIKAMSLQGLKPGTAKDWLAATINHHITMTARQIGELSEEADNAVPFHG